MWQLLLLLQLLQGQAVLVGVRLVRLVVSLHVLLVVMRVHVLLLLAWWGMVVQHGGGASERRRI